MQRGKWFLYGFSWGKAVQQGCAGLGAPSCLVEPSLPWLVLYHIPCNALRLTLKATRGFFLYCFEKAGPETCFSGN